MRGGQGEDAQEEEEDAGFGEAEGGAEEDGEDGEALWGMG